MNDLMGHYWNQIAGDVSSSKAVNQGIEELIDNSLDAGATRIAVTYDTKRKSLTIEDNGTGLEVPEQMFCLGDSGSIGDTKKSGHYGQGSKFAYIAIGDKVAIESVRKIDDEKAKCSMSWDMGKDIATGRWAAGRSCIVDDFVDAGSETGTTVCISGCQGKIKRWSQLGKSKNLGFQFTPAIDTGVTILLNDETLEAFKPEGKQLLSEKSEVDGQKFEVTLHETVTNPGLNVSKLHRRLDDFGDDVLEGLKLYARVKLFANSIGDWQLTKNKSDIRDDELKQLLNDSIAMIIKPVIDAKQNEARTIETRTHESLINGLMAAAFPSDAPTVGVECPKTPDKGAGRNANGSSSSSVQRRKSDPESKDITHDLDEGSGGLIEINFRSNMDGAYNIGFDKKTGTIKVNVQSDGELQDLIRNSQPDAASAMIGSWMASQLITDSRMRKHFAFCNEDNSVEPSDTKFAPRFLEWWQAKCN